MAISNTYWPLIWPEPESAEIEVLKGSLKLPTRTQSMTDEWIFPEPILAPEWKHKKLRKSKNSRKISIDYETGVTSVIIKDDFGSNRDLDNGLVISSKAEEIWSVFSGMLIAGGVIFLFFGSFRTSLLICLAMPLSLGLGIILMKLNDISINLLSLGGMALAVGMVVDIKGYKSR